MFAGTHLCMSSLARYIFKLSFLSDKQKSQSKSKAEIQAKIAELQADYNSKQYHRDRADAYPSWQDQLDNIYHNGIDAWKADIQAIKDKFPKL